MRCLLAAMLLGCVVAGAAHANTVSETITGRITGNSIDTFGYFGPAGTDLKGAPVTMIARYVTQDFNSSMPCFHGGCTSYSSTNTPRTPRSIFIQITVRGVTVTYRPVGFGRVTVFNGSNLITLESDTGSATNTGMFIDLHLRAPAKFGGPLTPQLGNTGDFLTFLQYNAAGETLNFTVTHATP